MGQAVRECGVQVQGELCHRLGPLTQQASNAPCFGQLCMLDGDEDSEARARVACGKGVLQAPLMLQLQRMLRALPNPCIRLFLSAREALQRTASAPGHECCICVTANNTPDPRTHNLPASSELGAIVKFGRDESGEEAFRNRDIRLRLHGPAAVT